MQPVRAKKSFGQHFLNDRNIAKKIVDGLQRKDMYVTIVEIGPGTGALTQFLKDFEHKLILVDADRESIEFLQKEYADERISIMQKDVLKMQISELTDKPVGLIGNMPYNISGPLLFMALEQREMITEWVGMLQKEVVDRVVAKPRTKEYGILSVLLQAYFHCELLFKVPPQVFTPPPKVHSAVLRLVPKTENLPDCEYVVLKNIVKTAFNQRRKTMRNSLKSLFPTEKLQNEFFTKRPEELSWEEFAELAKE
ncbi:MAG: 16S rRNA (adenine(1518)-N(6)/adenine(1519)-N(6))-dimethyltransferase [Marinilabiliales bacterium]|nr:MAG: 16S rRNA (adenine(1518)-N(6)/adenine(1519)-N(6))-dimethyltransferase [Marinilabiliales bacterium]